MLSLYSIVACVRRFCDTRFRKYIILRGLFQRIRFYYALFNSVLHTLYFCTFHRKIWGPAKLVRNGLWIILHGNLSDGRARIWKRKSVCTCHYYYKTYYFFFKLVFIILSSNNCMAIDCRAVYYIVMVGFWNDRFTERECACTGHGFVTRNPGGHPSGS